MDRSNSNSEIDMNVKNIRLPLNVSLLAYIADPNGAFIRGNLRKPKIKNKMISDRFEKFSKNRKGNDDHNRRSVVKKIRKPDSNMIIKKLSNLTDPKQNMHKRNINIREKHESQNPLQENIKKINEKIRPHVGFIKQSENASNEDISELKGPLRTRIEINNNEYLQPFLETIQKQIEATVTKYLDLKSPDDINLKSVKMNYFDKTYEIHRQSGSNRTSEIDDSFKNNNLIPSTIKEFSDLNETKNANENIKFGEEDKENDDSLNLTTEQSSNDNQSSNENKSPDSQPLNNNSSIKDLNSSTFPGDFLLNIILSNRENAKKGLRKNDRMSDNDILNPKAEEIENYSQNTDKKEDITGKNNSFNNVNLNSENISSLISDLSNLDKPNTQTSTANNINNVSTSKDLKEEEENSSNDNNLNSERSSSLQFDLFIPNTKTGTEIDKKNVSFNKDRTEENDSFNSEKFSSLKFDSSDPVKPNTETSKLADKNSTSFNNDLTVTKNSNDNNLNSENSSFDNFNSEKFSSLKFDSSDLVKPNTETSKLADKKSTSFNNDLTENKNSNDNNLNSEKSSSIQSDSLNLFKPNTELSTVNDKNVSLNPTEKNNSFNKDSFNSGKGSFLQSDLSNLVKPNTETSTEINNLSVDTLSNNINSVNSERGPVKESMTIDSNPLDTSPKNKESSFETSESSETPESEVKRRIRRIRRIRSMKRKHNSTDSFSTSDKLSHDNVLSNEDNQNNLDEFKNSSTLQITTREDGLRDSNISDSVTPAQNFIPSVNNEQTNFSLGTGEDKNDKDSTLNTNNIQDLVMSEKMKTNKGEEENKNFNVNPDKLKNNKIEQIKKLERTSIIFNSYIPTETKITSTNDIPTSFGNTSKFTLHNSISKSNITNIDESNEYRSASKNEKDSLKSDYSLELVSRLSIKNNDLIKLSLKKAREITEKLENLVSPTNHPFRMYNDCDMTMSSDFQLNDKLDYSSLYLLFKNRVKSVLA